MKLLIPLSLGLLALSNIYIPTKNAHSLTAVAAPGKNSFHEDAVEIYNNCGLANYGLSELAFEYALKGYNYLVEKNKIARNNYLTICDYSQSSLKKRLYIIDMINQKLITNTFVAHGKNSGGEFATSFSNKPESLKSSLGFYITDQTYQGKHGLSLRLKGVDGTFNNN